MLSFVVVVLFLMAAEAADYSCYNYSPLELSFKNSGAYTEKQICEHDPTRTFTRGKNARYNGCGSCWCCKEEPDSYDCYNYNKKEQKRIQEGKPESAVCNKDTLRKFTQGNNDNYPGCGACWCCKESWTCYNYSDLERQAQSSGAWSEKQACEHTGDRTFTRGANSAHPGCGSCWCCARG